jgi:hypothetical protein
MESGGPMKTGLWNTQKPTFSAKTQNLLKGKLLIIQNKNDIKMLFNQSNDARIKID